MRQLPNGVRPWRRIFDAPVRHLSTGMILLPARPGYLWVIEGSLSQLVDLCDATERPRLPLTTDRQCFFPQLAVLTGVTTPLQWCQRGMVPPSVDDSKCIEAFSPRRDILLS